MTPFKFWLIALAICLIAIPLCVAYVDRPAAEFFEAHVGHAELWHYLNRFLGLFLWILLGALVFLLGAGCWVIAGRRLAEWTRTPLLCSWSTMWGFVTETICKAISGRSLPGPTYFRTHRYGFHFLLGDPHSSSFPSGHTIIATAIVTALWIRSPRLRIPGVLLATAVAAALVVDNFHWVSDVLAGAFLGISIGWMTVRLQNTTFRTTD